MGVNFEGQKANQFLSKKQTTFLILQVMMEVNFEGQKANQFLSKKQTTAVHPLVTTHPLTVKRCNF